MKAFGCGKIADHLCRSHNIRCNSQGGPFVGITTVTSNKNVLCLENVAWATHYVFKKRTALKRRSILCRKENKKKTKKTTNKPKKKPTKRTPNQILKAVFFVKEGEKSCQYFRNKWPRPLEPGWVNPAFSKVITSLEALVQPSEARPWVMRALKHLSKHYSSCHRLWEPPLQNSKFSYVNSNDYERLHEITQRPSRITPSLSSALQQTSSKVSCVLRLISVSAHSRAK